jgi:hypothetical protein
MSTVEATLADYFQDWSARTDPFIFAKLLSDLLDRLLSILFDVLRQRQFKPSWQQLILADLASLHRAFSPHRPADKLHKPLDLAKKIVTAVFAASPRQFSMEAVALCKAAPEAAGLVEQWLAMRREDTGGGGVFDRQAFLDVMVGVQRRVREELDGGGGGEGGDQLQQQPTFLRHLAPRLRPK